MSCDFGVWYPQNRIGNEEAGLLYARLCAGDASGVVPHPSIGPFYAELTTRHPEIDTVPKERINDHDYCPWSCKIDHSPGHVIVSCVWSKADYVHNLVQELARKHGLALYDPQSDEIIYPDGRSGKDAQTGMSGAARWILGCFALLFAAIFVYSEQLSPSREPLVVYILAGFCLLIALACFSRRMRGPAIRVIGLTVFLVYAFYLVSELRNALIKSYRGSSEPHWFNALLGLVVFGLPGLYVAVRGKYPKWRKGAAAFRGEATESREVTSGLYPGILVETDLFEHREVKPHFINPCCFGEDFAAWLKERLAAVQAPGCSFSDLIQEDYGWGFFVWPGKDPFWVAFSYVGDGPQEAPANWVISVNYEPGLNLFKRFLQRPDQQALQNLRDQVRQIVSSNPDIKILSPMPGGSHEDPSVASRS